MLSVLEILPLALHFLVCLHFNVGFAPFETVLLIAWYEVVEQQGISAFLLIFGQDSYQHQIDTLGLVELECSQTMPPSERPQTTSAALLQRAGHRGDRDAHTNNVVVGCVPVFNQANQVHIEHGEIHLQVFIYLSLGHL